MEQVGEEEGKSNEYKELLIIIMIYFIYERSF